MKLTGIIEQTFHGQIIYRGFAPLRDLARLSQSKDYQRSADTKRINEIREFYNSSSFLFFPELIFGWALKGENTLKLIMEQSTGTINANDGVKFKKAKFVLPESNYIIGDIPTKKDLTIELPDEIVNSRPFSRIDGNHRLTVVDTLLEEEMQTGIKSEIGNMLVPYSILLQFDAEDNKKYESAYFYLINSRTKPLKTEENLKSILNSEKFSDVELRSLFRLDVDISIEKVRLILEFIRANSEVLDFISEIYHNEIFSLSMKIVKDLKNHINEIKRALVSVNLDYSTKRIKIKNQNVFFSALDIYLNYKNEYERFLLWINDNELGGIEQIPSDKLVELYIKTHVRKVYKVFVAMPYVSFKRVNDFNKLFKEVLEKEIPQKINAEIELIPIMRFKGSSQRIDQRLIKSIRDCHVFIADITGINENVIFEIGVAQGMDIPCLLIKANPDSDIRGIFDEAGLDIDKGIPFDMDKLQYVPYSLTGYYNDIKAIVKNNVIEILKVNYGVEVIEKK